MYSIIISGFRGQGVETASRVLAHAAFLTGKEVNSMLEYKENNALAYIRISPSEILEKGKISDIDCEIILDDMIEPLGGKIKVINSNHRIPSAVCIDAYTLAQKILKKPIVSTAMLGAFAAVNPLVNVRDIILGVEKVLKGKQENANILLVNEAYNMVKQ